MDTSSDSLDQGWLALEAGTGSVGPVGSVEGQLSGAVGSTWLKQSMNFLPLQVFTLHSFFSLKMIYHQGLPAHLRRSEDISRFGGLGAGATWKREIRDFIIRPVFLFTSVFLVI